MSIQGTRAPLTLAQAHVEGLDLVKQHTGRFTAYVTGLSPEHLGRRVPGGDWTVRQTVAHVASVYLRYTSDRRRSSTPAGVAAQNADDLAAADTDVNKLASTITEQLSVFAAVASAVSPEQRFPFHAGQQVTLAAGWGNLLGELLAHGDDIARATGLPFTIPSADTEILWRFTAPALQGWLRPEAADAVDTWLLHFPFGPIAIAFDHGRLGWGVELDSVDYVITVDDAAEFTLVFPYRRRTPPDALTGRLLERFVDV